MIRDLKTKIGLKYKKNIDANMISIAGGEDQFCRLYESDLIYGFNDKVYNLLVDIACKVFNISIDEFNSKSNKSKLVKPRAAVMYLVDKYTCMTNFALAKKMDKDHSTINHFLNITKDPMLSTFDKQFYKLIDECHSQFLTSVNVLRLTEEELITMLRNRINKYEDLIIRMVHKEIDAEDVVENLC